jgi:hypothetical protein
MIFEIEQNATQGDGSTGQERKDLQYLYINGAAEATATTGAIGGDGAVAILYVPIVQHCDGSFTGVSGISRRASERAYCRTGLTTKGTAGRGGIRCSSKQILAF